MMLTTNELVLQGLIHMRIFSLPFCYEKSIAQVFIYPHTWFVNTCCSHVMHGNLVLQIGSLTPSRRSSELHCINGIAYGLRYGRCSICHRIQI